MPVETEANPVQGFECHEMAASWARVKGVEEAATEGCRWDDQEEASTGTAEWLGVYESVMLDANESIAQWVAVARGKVAEGFLGKVVVGVEPECGVNGLEDGIGGIAVFPIGGWG